MYGKNFFMKSRNYKIIKRIVTEEIAYVLVVYISYAWTDEDSAVKPQLAIAGEIKSLQIRRLLINTPIALVIRHMRMYYRLENFQQMKNIRSIVTSQEMKDITSWMDNQIEYHIYLIAPLNPSDF